MDCFMTQARNCTWPTRLIREGYLSTKYLTNLKFSGTSAPTTAIDTIRQTAGTYAVSNGNNIKSSIEEKTLRTTGWISWLG